MTTEPSRPGGGTGTASTHLGHWIHARPSRHLTRDLVPGRRELAGLGAPLRDRLLPDRRAALQRGIWPIPRLTAGQAGRKMRADATRRPRRDRARSHRRGGPGHHPAPDRARHLAQILLSHDIAYKHRLTRWGGFGDHHLLVNVIPRLRAKGADDRTIETLLVDNPRRAFVYA